MRDRTVRLVLARPHNLGRREDVEWQRNVLVSGPIYDWISERNVLRAGDDLPLLRNFCVDVAPIVDSDRRHAGFVREGTEAARLLSAGANVVHGSLQHPVQFTRLL